MQQEPSMIESACSTCSTCLSDHSADHGSVTDVHDLHECQFCHEGIDMEAREVVDLTAQACSLTLTLGYSSTTS